jgi:transcriptional regulator with XRE-family HTH domain
MKNDLGNKKVMAENLQYYMDKLGVDRHRLSDDIGVPYTTVCDWIKGNSYPRIDKIEIMADYFNVSKADLIEHYEVHKAADNSDKIDGVYLSFARDAQNKGIDPEDIKKALAFIKSVKKGE